MAAGSGLTAAADFSITCTIIGFTSGSPNYSLPANNYWACYTTQFTAALKAGATEWLVSSDTAYARQAVGAAGAGWTVSAYASGVGVVWRNFSQLTQPAVTGASQTLFSCAWCDALTGGNINFFVDLASSDIVGVGTNVILTATTGAVFTTY